MTESNLTSQRGKSSKMKKQKSTLPQSFEEVVQMWEKTRFRIPDTFDRFLYSDDPWKQDGFDEDISDDFKTSEGTMLFAREENGCEVYLELPFKSVRTYGNPVVSSATFFDEDKNRIAFVFFKDGKADEAGTFDERMKVNRLERTSRERCGSEETK